MTCVKVVPMLLLTYSKASFGFGAARTYGSITNRVESYENNQRFRLYKKLPALKFGEVTYAHFKYERISCYLLVNRSCNSIDIKERTVVQMFSNPYRGLPDIR